MANYVYAIAVAQFLLGCIIAVLNLILLLATSVDPNIRTGPRCLLGNMWFANVLLGVIVAISNVIDQSGIYVFQKTEGTIAIVNGFATISMLLALTTNRVITIRNPTSVMSTKTSFKIIITTWSIILSLTFIKAIVYGLDKIETVDACFRCFLSFEVSALVIFAVITLIVFFISIYLICSHRRRTVSDADRNHAAASVNGQKEYKMTVTIGMLLTGFTLTFLAFVFLIPAWLTSGSRVDADATEIIITLFYTHGLINPIIALIRDEELRKSACRILHCQRPNRRNAEPQPETQSQPPLQQTNAEVQIRQPANDRTQAHAQNQRTPAHLPPIESPAVRKSTTEGPSDTIERHNREGVKDDIKKDTSVEAEPRVTVA